MGLASILLTDYTFEQILKLAFADIGATYLLGASVAFLGLAAYLVGAPFRGALWNTRPRVIGFNFIQQLVYIASFILLLVSFSSLIEFLGYYLPVFAASFINVISLPRLLTYEAMEKARSHPLSMILTGLRNNLLGLALVWAVFGIEMFALIVYNPTLPLISWFLLIYSYLMLLLQAALFQGFLFQAQNAPFVKVTTQDSKEFSGFLLGKGTDNYSLLTKEDEMLIQTGFVKHMTTVYAERKRQQPSKKERGPPS